MKLEEVLEEAREGRKIRFREGEYEDLYSLLSGLKLGDIISGEFELEPRELRRVQFEGYLYVNDSFYDNLDPMSNALKCALSEKHFFLKEPLEDTSDFWPGTELTKWKVTMEEEEI